MGAAPRRLGASTFSKRVVGFAHHQRKEQGMSASSEEIARDILIASIDRVAVGPAEDIAGKLAKAYKTILEGVDSAVDENWLRKIERNKRR